MVYRLFLFLFFYLSVLTTFSQSFQKKENNIWLGGTPYFHVVGTGMDLGTGNPATLNSSWASGNGGSASVCDSEGELLFYTDGNVVWDRKHSVMQDGWDINNNGNMAPGTTFLEPTFGQSSYNYDGVVIIPVPGSSHQYYIISGPDMWELQSNPNSIPVYTRLSQFKLYCSIVDMELNNGRGGLIAGQRGRVIADSMAGNLHAVTGENCDYWLVGYGSDGVYKSFHITASGMDTIPVRSALTPPIAASVAEIDLSPDRRKAATAFGDYVEVCDFDPATGRFSNPVAIGGQYSNNVAFSPDGKLLYIGGLVGLRQYIVASLSTPFTLLTFNNMTAWEYDGEYLRLGPDDKIYFTNLTAITVNGNTDLVPFAACIEQPNLVGTACQAVRISNQKLPLLTKDYMRPQLPNEIPVLTYESISAVHQIPLCFNKPVVLQAGSTNGTDYHWMENTVGYNYSRTGNDTTTTLTVTQPGKYAVQYFTSSPCQLHRDTFIVPKVSYSLYLGADTTACEGQPVLLQANVPGAEFRWQDESTGNSFLADHSGLYWVETIKEGCKARDTVAVQIIDIRQNLGKDTTVCQEIEEQIPFHAMVPEGAHILWNTGSTQPSISVRDSGLYWVQVTSGYCIGSDSIWLHKEYCDCPILFPTAFSPNNDGINDLYKPAIPGNCTVHQYKIEIFNRWGQVVFASNRPDEGWDGRQNNHPADIGNYSYRVELSSGLQQLKTIKKGIFLLVR